MDNKQTISWIFLAIALSSNNSLADIESIYDSADYINKSVPTEEEMQSSISWLINKQLVLKTENKYSLSESGKAMYKETLEKIKGIIAMRENLENKILVLL